VAARAWQLPRRNLHDTFTAADDRECGRTAWIILAQVCRPSLYRRHDLNALQTEQPNGLSSNVMMKPPDSGSNKRTSHEGESRDTITIIFLQHRHSSYYKPGSDRVLQT
jgi:hypothetical protein